MKHFLTICAFMAALSASAQIPYKVIVPVPDVAPGTIVYMTNYDTDQIIDSVAVADQKALFTGDVDDPFLVNIGTPDKLYGTTIIEQGTSTINQATNMGVGTMLNDQLKGYYDTLTGIIELAKTVQTDEQVDSLYDQFMAFEKSAVVDNIDNPIGYFFFIDYAPQAPLNEVLALLEQNPDLLNYDKVKAIKTDIDKKAATSVGKKFVDFEVTYDGVTKRLSDYVGKGQYVLVDFWASWCGPCMREIETIREIYNTYPQDKLKVLGVAVWDKPEDTKKAIEAKNIPWECIIDAQKIPTDAYGIKGIPTIILFGPDGTILSRDLQGRQLKEAVAKVL